MREKATIMRDVGRALLGGRINDRTARSYAAVNREVRRDVVEGEKLGLDVALLGDEAAGAAADGDDDADRRLEADLTAQLEAVRERRMARAERFARDEEEAILAAAEKIKKNRERRGA
jgi:hypothetical protein